LGGASVDKSEVEQQIMIEASNVSVLFSAIFFFFLGCLIASQHIQGNLHVLQRSILRKRLEYSMFVCLYICFFSCLFNCIQYAPHDDHVLAHVHAQDTAVLDLGRPIEWILTCPLMQIILPILGGEKVKDYRRASMPLNSALVLVFGLCASFQTFLPFKLAFYFCGLSSFGVLCIQMNKCIEESTGGEENMFWGTSIIRQLTVIVVLTWIPFPIWYALSPEGFNYIDNSAAMKIAVAFLNVISKGFFMFYLMRIRAELEMREITMAEAKLVQESEETKYEVYDANTGESQPAKLVPGLAVAVHEVLKTMGREADFDALKALLEGQMVTSYEDMMVLTQEYCYSVNIPWGFVTACKARIRQQRLEKGESYTWSMHALKKSVSGVITGDDPNDERLDSIGIAPLPPHVANDPRKLAQSRQLEQLQRDWAASPGPDAQQPDFDLPSSHSAVHAPRSPRSPRLSKQVTGAVEEKDAVNTLQAAIDSSNALLLQEIREMKHAQMEEASRIGDVEQRVHSDLSAVHDQMGGMVTSVMDAIDHRLKPASPRQARPERPLAPPARGDGQGAPNDLSVSDIPQYRTYSPG
jgi:bacteriorhodopsin